MNFMVQILKKVWNRVLETQYQQFDLLPEEFPQGESKWWDRVYQYYDKYA